MSSAGVGSVGIGSTPTFGHVLPMQTLERTSSMRSDGSAKRDKHAKRRLARGVQVQVQVPKGGMLSPFSPVGVIPSPAHSMPTPNHSQLLLTPDALGGIRNFTSRNSQRTAAELKAQDLLASAALQLGIGGLKSPSAASTYSAFSTATNPQGEQMLVWADECPSATIPSYDAVQQLEAQTAALQSLVRQSSQGDLRQAAANNYTPSGVFGQSKLPSSQTQAKLNKSGYDARAGDQNLVNQLMNQFAPQPPGGAGGQLESTREMIQAKHLAQQQILFMRQQMEIQTAEQQQKLAHEQRIAQQLQQLQQQQLLTSVLPSALASRPSTQGGGSSSNVQMSPSHGSNKGSPVPGGEGRKASKDKKIMLGGDEVGSRSPASGSIGKSPSPRVSRTALTPAERRLVIAIESYLIDDANNKFGGSVPVVVIQRVVQAASKEDYDAVVVEKYAKSFHSFIKNHETFKLFHYTQEWIEQFGLSHCSTHEGRICFADVSKEDLTARDAKTAQWKADKWAAVLDEVEAILRKEPVHMKTLMQLFKESEKVDLYSCVLPSNHSLRQLLKKQPERFVILTDAMVKLPEQLTEDERTEWQARLKELDEKNTVKAQQQQQQAAAAASKAAAAAASNGRRTPSPHGTPQRTAQSGPGKKQPQQPMMQQHPQGTPQQRAFANMQQGGGVGASPMPVLLGTPQQTQMQMHGTPQQANLGGWLGNAGELAQPQAGLMASDVAQLAQNIVSMSPAAGLGLQNDGLSMASSSAMSTQASMTPGNNFTHSPSRLLNSQIPGAEGIWGSANAGQLGFNSLGGTPQSTGVGMPYEQHNLRYDPSIAQLALKVVGQGVGGNYAPTPIMHQFGQA